MIKIFRFTESKFKSLHLPVCIFFLALVIRLAYLFYNLSWNLPESWANFARISVVAAETMLGKTPSFPGIPTESAWVAFHFDDRGLALLHMLFYKVFGKSLLLYVQLLNVFIDSLMVFPAIFLGKRLAGEKFGAIVGFAYAAYLPQIFTAVQPLWYAILNAGTFILIAVAVRLYYSSSNGGKRAYFFWSALIFLITISTSQFRSTVVFFPIFIGLISAVFYRSQKKLLVSCFLTGGILTIFGGVTLNKQLAGTSTPMRTNIGHVFFIGVGEFNNPYGLIEADDSAMNLYRKSTGKDIFTNGAEGINEFDNWLKKRAIEFLKEHPFLYASMVLRRALKFLFPNYRLQRVADEEAYLANVQKTVTHRTAITKSGRLFSIQGIKELWGQDKIFFFELIVRGLFFFMLPFGAGIAVWRMQNRTILPLYLSGLFYGIATLAPLRGPVMNHYSVWSVTLPLVVWGWYSIFRGRHLEQSSA